MKTDFHNFGGPFCARQGSSDGFVSAVQAMLWSSGYQTATGPVAGIFGQQTRTDLMHFQNLEGIVADGIAGPITWSTFENYTSSGFTSRTYNHWQSSYYN
ncbi:peptidoglycan-binding domain-containing protein [Natronobacillus azotifigens]|uniref:peptidoglycan-binding domain-containing protein n=1 Tax=Natronobacillus azotifigens TaxID=472978 RepID=UPI003AEFFDDE